MEENEFEIIGKLISEKNGQVDNRESNSNNEKKERLAELRSMQDSATNYIEDVTQEHNDTIENVTKENSVASVQKQNYVQKWISKITNKINGKKKFEENVITPLEQKTNKIKEEEDQKVDKSIKDKLKEMYNNGKEKLGEVAASKEAKTLLNIAIQGSKPIIMASFGAKGAIISSVVTAVAGNLTQQNNKVNTEELMQE